MKAYPTEFEITDEMNALARVTVNDECTCKIEFLVPAIGLHEWRELADKIGECMAQMIEVTDENV